MDPRIHREGPLKDAVGERVVEFPLRGEGWTAFNSPADRIPSHGTDMLGQRYAIDLLKVDDRRSPRFHPASTLRTLLLGVPTRECYAWGQPVHSPVTGEVVRAVSDRTEPERVHPVTTLLRVLRNTWGFRPDRLPDLLGNHVILSSGSVYAALVHLAPGSVEVSPGQQVETGDVLGRVGHTGNSTSPHLHFQLMDSVDPMQARGIPFSFRHYEVLSEGRWLPVDEQVPARSERIRSPVAVG